jgi:hypothetical protein
LKIRRSAHKFNLLLSEFRMDSDAAPAAAQLTKMSGDVAVLFPETSRIREAMAIINSLEPKKLKVVVGRLCKAIGGKTANEVTVFSDSERTELLEHLRLSSSELETLLGACSFILEQSAYHLVKPADLSSQLQLLGMSEPQVN